MADYNRVKHFIINVSDIYMELAADESLFLRIDEGHRDFIANDVKPDISVKVHYGELPELLLEEKLYDTAEQGGLWSLYRSGEKYTIVFISASSDSVPYRAAIMNDDFTGGDLYINAASPINQIDDSQESFNPVDYPFDEILYINYLSQGRGVNLHACGISIENKGIIFSGVSGAGKSTIAELWKKRDVHILSDDRIIVRPDGDEFHMFGTPWHGDARVSLPEKVPLKGLYFLEQSKINDIIPLKTADCVFRLMTRCFPTFYSRQGMEYTLDILTRIVEQTPCYEFQFTRDQSALDTVIDHVKDLK